MEKRDRGTKSGKNTEKQVLPAQPGQPNHDEWLLDEAIEESFPGSDVPSPARPGSTLAKRHESRRKPAAKTRKR
jgi:hypothetical protein